MKLPIVTIPRLPLDPLRLSFILSFLVNFNWLLPTCYTSGMPRVLHDVKSGTLRLGAEDENFLRAAGARQGNVVGGIRTKGDVAVAIAQTLPPDKAADLLAFMEREVAKREQGNQT